VVATLLIVHYNKTRKVGDYFTSVACSSCKNLARWAAGNLFRQGDSAVSSFAASNVVHSAASNTQQVCILALASNKKS
jgi:hypothetical protein